MSEIQATVPAEKIENLIRAIDSTTYGGIDKLWLLDRLRALLPPPPLVIEPGRWYRTRDGRKAFVIEVTDDGVRGFLPNPVIAAFVVYEWHPGGTVWMEDDPADADLIALWEDTDAD